MSENSFHQKDSSGEKINPPIAMPRSYDPHHLLHGRIVNNPAEEREQEAQKNWQTYVEEEKAHQGKVFVPRSEEVHEPTGGTSYLSEIDQLYSEIGPQEKHETGTHEVIPKSAYSLPEVALEGSVPKVLMCPASRGSVVDLPKPEPEEAIIKNHEVNTSQLPLTAQPRPRKSSSLFSSIILFIIVFFGAMIILNFSAYFQIANYYLSNWKAGDDDVKSPQEVLIEQGKTEVKISDHLPEGESNLVSEVANALPPLTMEVMPPDNRVVIPRLNKNVPIMEVDSDLLENRKWNELESAIQEKLKEGVVHYPHTAKPYEIGNMFLTGHSSYYLWDYSEYKDIFALLHVMKIDDEFMIYYEGRRYVYRVSEIKDVAPGEVDALMQGNRQIATLMTCTPPGTNLRRLLVIAELTDKK